MAQVETRETLGVQTEEAPGVPKELECSLPGISSFWKGVTPELGNRVQEAHNVDNVTFSHPVETGGLGLDTRFSSLLCSVFLSPGTRAGGGPRDTGGGSGGRWPGRGDH